MSVPAMKEQRGQVVVHADPASIMEVISRAASDPATDVNKLERLMAMYERMAERSARSAYAAALAQMQPELPAIAERGKIDIGRGKPQSYALWEDINDAIKPVLQRHGFALSFRTGRDGDKITVTGVLSHREGHSEETTLLLPVDTSGSKNAVQAVGSSTSYGKRYTAAALLNLTSRGEDDDGKAAGIGPKVTQKQADAIVDLLEAKGKDRAKFLSWAGVASIEDIPAALYDQCVTAINSAKRKA